MEWFRFYHEALDDPKVQRLPPGLFKQWVNLLCLASRHAERGTLPPINEIAFALRLKPSEAAKIVQDLAAAGLLDPLFSDQNAEIASDLGRYSPHNWANRQPMSDDIAARVQAHRTRQQALNQRKSSKKTVTRNDDVTLHVTPDNVTCNVLDQIRSDQIREDQNPPNPQTEPPPTEGAATHATPRSKTGKLTTHQQAAFDVLWSKYPARNGVRGPKQEAAQAFGAIAEADWPDLARALDNYRAVCAPPDGRLPKDACRFLKNDYWRDYVDIDPPTRNGGQTHDKLGAKFARIQQQIADGLTDGEALGGDQGADYRDVRLLRPGSDARGIGA